MEKTTNSSSRKKRGPIPPSISLETALAIIRQIYEKGGEEIHVNSLATEIVKSTPKSSSFWGKISSLRSFDLIEKSGDLFKLSKKAHAIVAPQSEEESMQAKKESFCNLEQFSKIYERYKSRLLPEKQFLANILSREFGVSDDLKDDWATVFMSSARAAGLIQERSDGKMLLVETPTPLKRQVELPQAPQALERRAPLEPELASAPEERVRITLQKGRNIQVSYAPNLTQEECEVLKAALDGLRSFIESILQRGKGQGS